MHRVSAALAHHPRVVLAAVALVTVAAATQIVDFRTGGLRLALDPSFDRLVMGGGEPSEVDDLTRRVFGASNTLVVALIADDLFTAQNLESLSELTQRVEQLDGVRRTLSLANAMRVEAAGDDVLIEPFLATIPVDEAGLTALRRAATEHPLYAGNLVSRDGRAALLVVHLADAFAPDAAGTDRPAGAVGERIEAIARQVDPGAGVEIWVTGTPYLQAALTHAIGANLARVLPLSLLAVAAVGLFAFRSWRGVWVTGSTVVIAVVWTLGAVAAAGVALNLITALIPILVVAIGFAYAVHVVAEFLDHPPSPAHSPSSPSPDWAAEALARVALPVALTGMTTAVGFASLGLSRLMAVREFGALAVLGVATSLLVSFIYTPAMLQELRAAKRRRPEGGGRLDRIAGRLAAFDITNRHAILAGGAALALASLAGAFQLRVGTDVLTNLPRESEVRGRIDSLTTHFERASSFSIVVQADRPDAFRDPETLRQLQQLQGWLEARPEVSQTASLADTLMWINSALHGNDAAYFAVPDSRALVSQLLFFAGGEDLLGFVDAPYQQARVAVDSTIRDSGELATLLEQIELRLAELPAGLTATVTGDSVLGSRTLNEVARGQVASLSAAFVGIFLVLTVLFSSLRVGALALIPNALPVAAYFGLLGLTGITLNATTGLVACMVLGIAVDDTIHFLVRFNESARALASEHRGAIEALRRVVRPVTITTAALCAGLSALAFSELQNQVEFGALAAATLALAWLVDVVLTPALTSRLRIVTLWDVLTLDLGHDPRHSIPIFRGMSHRQARVVALMTRVRNFEPGHLLLRQGETGDQIYALINGEVEVSVTAGGRRVSLGILARGDVAGEVALFGGRLQTDVRTRSSVRALEFTERDLDEHLLKRYPRIGARFYQNLSGVIAQRLTPLDHEQRMRLMRLVCSFAWADRVVQPEEKGFIARLILRLELDPDERRQVEAWLEKPPSVEKFDPERVPHEHRVLFVESVAALLLADGDLAPEELEVFRPLIS